MSSSWEFISNRKKEEQSNRIPREYRLPKGFKHGVVSVIDVPKTCGLLTLKELAITEKYDATSLAWTIREGKFSALEVTTAFCKRAAIAHQVVCRKIW